MRIQTALRMAAAVMALVLPGQAVAVEFVPVGPRAAGMGGAGVAVTTDAYASYWNPAGLAMVKSLDVRIQGTAQVIGTNGMINALDNLKDFNPNDTSPVNLVNAQNRQSPDLPPEAFTSKAISASMPLDSTSPMSRRQEAS